MAPSAVGDTPEWLEQAIALKDQMSVRDLAKRFNVSAGQIAVAFKRAKVSRTARVVPSPAPMKEAAGQNPSVRPGS